MNRLTKIIAITAVAIAAGAGLTGCTSKADTISQNISTDADNFKVNRQIILNDDFTNTYIATVEGRCSLGNSDPKGTTTVTCKIGKDKYVKEIFRTGQNATVSSIQTEPIKSDPFHYTIVLKPESVIPHIELFTSGNQK